MSNAVFLSASVPDSRRTSIYSKTADSVAIAAAVSALVYVTLGRRMLVWGGHPAITPMIWVVAEDLKVDYGEWVKLYQTKYFQDDFPDENRRFHNVIYTAKVKGDRTKSLAAMRRRMFSEQRFHAAVFIGGMKGVIEECDLLRQLQPDTKLLPVASTGGASLALAEKLKCPMDADLREDLDYVAVFHRNLSIDVKENRYRKPADQPRRIEDRLWVRPSREPRDK